jgi:hypothetical protein
MYSLGNLLQREPVAIAGAIRSVLWLAVLLGWVNGLDEQALAGIALTAEVVLGLFARNASTSTAAPKLEAGTEVAIAGTNDTVRLAAPPAPSTPIEGGQNEDGLTGPDGPEGP